MGNQLVGIAPSQIFPVEHYLTDLRDFQFDKNLGSTRFFKVARAKSQEGLVVVKVFAIHDPTLPLTTYKDRVEEIRLKLGPAINCLPFQKAILTDRAGYLLREYIKYSLYDRISTRPFLLPLEKKWIAFQLLYGLLQSHKFGICHGDIKLENILVTSWHWVMLSDFASFKPTHLPEDNPADFSYFFDTSRRRTCYIAPERFIKSLPSETSSQLLLAEENLKKGDLTPAMDIFSAGCALAELFSDGHPPFDFSQLLAYRCREYSVDKHLEKVEDEGVRELLRVMMQRDAAKRQTAEILLAQERDRVFPNYFYSFLHPYINIFSGSHPMLSADEKIEKLRKDISDVIEMLSKCKDDKGEEKPCYEALIIITSLVTSCARGLHLSNSKLQCLELLLEIASYLPAEIILDRIIPYIFYFVHDSVPRVKILAIHTLTQCLSLESLIHNIPPSDTNIFPEYVLPGLNSVAHDEAVIVRTAFAEDIAQLAETALRFLEHSQVATLKSNETPRHSYESELATLHEMIQQAVSTLLTDPQNVVKQTLIENGITKLCVFFGKQKANDILLSHMITFLNDKEDKNLRSSFFDCIVGVAAYIGVHSSPILTPLLQQGLTDPEEFVVRKAINAMSALTELSLLHKSALYELLEETACLLVHPNLWIRQAIVGFISALARTLNIVDVQCKVMVVIEPYLKSSVIQVEKEVLILNALKPCIPRVVYNTAVRCSDLDLFLHTLSERQRARGFAVSGHAPSTLSISTSPKQNNALRNLFSRLSSEGMTEAVEDQLVAISKHLRKIHKNYAALSSKSAVTGKIDAGSLRNPVQCHAITLVGPEYNKTDNSGMSLNSKVREDSLSNHMNEEWRHMFGGAETIIPSKLNENQSRVSPIGLCFSTEGQISPQRSLDIDYSIQERSYIQYRCAPCRLELRQLLNRKQEIHSTVVRNREWVEHKTWLCPPLPPPGWRLRGALVAHLHEHKGAVNRMLAIPETAGLFASCSSDGCIRLWDCAKMEGRNIANRSRQVYNTHAGPLTGFTLCLNNQSIAAANDSGSIFLLRMETSSNKMSLLSSRQLDLQEEGTAVDIAYFNSGSNSVLVYATMYGNLIGWDLRKPGDAFRLDNDLKQGVITAMCIDSRQCSLSLGTSSGYITCWDLRFQLPVATMAHPQSLRVRRLVTHPTEPSWLISSVQGNNEIGMWNIESGSRQLVLWPSNAPPLSNTQLNDQSMFALYAANVDRTPFLLSGGTDHRVRYWVLDSPNESYMAIHGGSDTPGQTSFSYKSRLVDGTNIVQEVQSRVGSSRSGGNSEELPRAGPDPPPTGHHDTISDIALCHASQCFLLTGSRDGVIKVWK
ncbi:vacuolar protein sorting 15 isoform X2 [Lycorma delicatula]|uniref:vacuolar protein sorting 15 isoform X2 n=1 Tax=Lycorma delicatula TaxID=130591 RepID=UPI003F50DDA5